MEFESLRHLLIGLTRFDDNGPVLTIEDVFAIDRAPDVIIGRIRYVDERAVGHPARTSDFKYNVTELAVEGPDEAADLLVVNLEEEVLAAD